MDSEATWLAIEYVRGNLSETDMAAVEERMISDREFYLLVRDLRAIQRAESREVDSDAEIRAQAAADDYFFSSQRKSRRKPLLWLAAAAAIALIAMVTLLIVQGGRSSHLDTYFDPGDGEFSLGTSPTDAIRRGMQRFQAADYEGAIQELRSIADTARQYNTAAYYIAKSYLALHKPDSALPHLLALERMNDHEYQDGRWWLLGLIYLDQGREEKGRQQLQFLLDDQTNRYKEAEAREILGL